MGWLSESLNSSIGKKFLMALTGLMLIIFLIVHFIGNMTLYFGADAFNAYVEALDAVKPLIRVIEVVLASVFIIHIFSGIRLWYQNKQAKGINYTVNAAKENSTLFSRTMVVSGSIVFIFLVLHLSTFFVKFNFTGHAAPGAHLDYYEVVVSYFNMVWYSILYIIAMVLLGFHLNHGFQSAFQTFGWNHSKYFGFIQKVGTVYAVIMALGFASIPVYFLFFAGGN